MHSYWDRMSALGETRCRILMCMGGENAHTTAYFNPPAGRLLIAEFYEHLLRLWLEKDSFSAPILAAGLATYGSIDAVEYLITNLPASRIHTDHGAGWCAAYPLQVVATILPLPSELCDPSRWTLSDREGEELSEWFLENRERLGWDLDQAKFVMLAHRLDAPRPS
jgi:hypothetical protein